MDQLQLHVKRREAWSNHLQRQIKGSVRSVTRVMVRRPDLRAYTLKRFTIISIPTIAE
jgi:hypothetical protein